MTDIDETHAILQDPDKDGDTRHPERTEQAPAIPYQPTPEERAVAMAYLSRMEGTPPLPKIKVRTEQGVIRLEPDHPDRVHHP